MFREKKKRPAKRKSRARTKQKTLNTNDVARGTHKTNATFGGKVKLSKKGKKKGKVVGITQNQRRFTEGKVAGGKKNAHRKRGNRI